MRIYIKSGRLRLFFGLPLSALKSRLASRIITDAVKSKSDSCQKSEFVEAGGGSVDNVLSNETRDTDVSIEVDEQYIDLPDNVEVPEKQNSVKSEFVADRELLKKVYGALKKVIKDNGHFTLVDVSADNGKTKVRIRI